MRRITLFSLITLALTSLLAAQGNPSSDGEKKPMALLPYQKAFSNLPEEKRITFIKHHREASRLFSEKRIFETLEALKLADQAFEGSPEVWNLRGSCYVELRSFDKALNCFKKATEKSKDNYSIQFNIGEVYFVTQEWEKAHQAFEDLLKNLPENSKDLNRITEFKLLLCKLKLDRKQEAKILAEKYDYLDDSPYHYFAKATLAYEEDDAAEAEQWIARAARIFRNNAILAPWHDTLVEYGHIKSFYGGSE